MYIKKLQRRTKKEIGALARCGAEDGKEEVPLNHKWET